jgi:hypothetical protein
MVNWKRTMMAAASSGSEDGWLTRIGDGTKDFTYNNYFRSFGVEYEIADVQNPIAIYYDETNEKIWLQSKTRQFSDNNASPSGQAMDALWRFNDDGTWDNYSQQWQYNGAGVRGEGFSIHPISSNRMMLNRDKGANWNYINPTNSAFEGTEVYASNFGGGQVSKASPVKMGNSHFGIARFDNNTGGAILQYNNSNLLQTGQRRKTAASDYTNGHRPDGGACCMAGTSSTNWFFLANKSVSSTYISTGIVKCSGVVPQSAGYIPTSYWTGISRGAGRNYSIACDSSGNVYQYLRGTDSYNYIVKYNSSLVPQKIVSWYDTSDTDQYSYYSSFLTGNDGNFYLYGFRNGYWKYLQIDQGLNSIGAYQRGFYRPQGSSTSVNAIGGGDSRAFIDSRNNIYASGRARFDNISFGGQSATGWHSTLYKIPVGGLAAGTHDLSGGSSYFSSADIVITAYSSPTLSTHTNPTLTSFTYNTNSENTGNYNYYNFGNLGNRLASVSFDRRNYPIA